MSQSISSIHLQGTDAEHALALYRTMVLSREIERVERSVISRGEGHFQICSAGHEANAALGEFLGKRDWLACHYRDRALMLARGVAPKAFFDALIGNDHSSSRGRQLNVMHSSRELNLLSMPVSVGNNLLPAVGIATQVKNEADAPIVYASVGDGTTQQGDFFEAVSEAVRSHLPMLFLVQDNGYALSTATSGKTFFSLPDGNDSHFLGLPVEKLDGTAPLACRTAFAEMCQRIRQSRGPVLALMRGERLESHSNADDQTLYRTRESLDVNATERDPIAALRFTLEEAGIEETTLLALEESVRDEVRGAAEAARQAPAPTLSLEAKRPLDPAYRAKTEYVGDGATGGLVMREALRKTLENALEADPAICLYGEDIEDPKGDVFGVTKGLSTKFPEQVINSPLAEATIMGVSMGRALAGAKPVAFIQFADFIPLIQNLFHNELASMFWRSDGTWQCPVLLMVSCGGYRAGTGPFHTQTMEAALAHTPGVDVVMPSTAADAAGMLNAALRSQRPTVFLYPKNLINNSTRAASPDVAEHWVPVGRARKTRLGEHVTLAGYGNTAPICEDAARALADLGVSAEVLDLRSISPWDEAALRASAEKTGHLVIAHEDNRFAGFGAEIAATIAESARPPVKIKRVTRPDCFAPYNVANQLEMLPSAVSVLEAAATLLGLDLGWRAAEESDGEIELVEAMGVGASDDTVTLVEWSVQEGDKVEPDDILAILEAEKASAELLASRAGMVEKLLVDEGDSVRIGTPILRLRGAEAKAPASGKPALRVPFLRTPFSGKNGAAMPDVSASGAPVPTTTIRLAGVTVAHGSQTISNDQLLERFPDKSSEEIVRMTGIESRNWVGPDQTLLSLAAEATEQLFAQTGARFEEIDLIVCATTTPDNGTPSLALRLLHQLAPEHECPGYDLSAACSGYLYALDAAYNYLRNKPAGKVLVVTAETLSKTLDLDDYATAILFGDAATATLVTADETTGGPGLRLDPPVINGKGESGEYLRVPLMGGGGGIAMHGKQVFHDAVAKMAETLRTACARKELDLQDLDAIIPHQANQRILRALGKRMRFKPERVWDNIARYGNTSSCTIPICLAEGWDRISPGEKVALVAFGGGFTYGAALLEA